MSKFSWIAAILLIFLAFPVTSFAATSTDQVRYRYVVPDDPVHKHIYEEFRKRMVLERIREFLSPYRLPRKLRIVLDGCDGEADAFFDDGTAFRKDQITICYEYIEDLVNNMPAETTPAGVEPYDAVVGPIVDTVLHEFAHALFSMLDVPIFGREEDAADQLAAYVYLQFEPEEALRLISGTAYAFLNEAKREEEIIDQEGRGLERYSDEHSTPAQRGYNVLCMAYGADVRKFEVIVSGGYLPESRAEFCEEQYEQVQDAYEALIFPHIDLDLADEIFGKFRLKSLEMQEE